MSSVSNNNTGFAAKIFSLLGLVIIGYLSQQDKSASVTLPDAVSTTSNISPALLSKGNTQSSDSVVFVRTSVAASQRSEKAPALAP